MSYTLKMCNYKKTKDRTLVLHNGLTILSSRMAGGKSSVVESIALCLGLEKKALSRVIMHGTDFCSLSLDVNAPGVAVQKTEVEIYRNSEGKGYSRRLLNGSQVPKEDFWAAMKPLGTNSLGTVLPIVNHDYINQYPDDDKELTEYMRKMSGTDALCRTSEYKKAEEALKLVEIQMRNLDTSWADLPEDERTVEKELAHERARRVLEDEKDAAHTIIRVAHEAREHAFCQFVHEVSSRLNDFIHLFWKDELPLKASLEVNEGVAMWKIQMGGNERTMSTICSSERQVIHLALSFSILTQFNVPFAIVDNVDCTFVGSYELRLMKFCEAILENSKTMKAIVLASYDYENVISQEGYNVVEL